MARHGGLTLEAIQRATNTASAQTVALPAVTGTGWELGRVRRASVRLEPPRAYWATYAVRVTRSTRQGEEQRELTLIARACFDADDWTEYRNWLAHTYGDAPCRPLDGLGAPLLDDAQQVAWWFYPVDPHLPTLATASDPRNLRRLLAPRYSAKSTPARITVEPVRYLPEISAAVRYRVVDRPGAPEQVYFGKVYRGGRGHQMHLTMRALWELSERHPDLLRVVEPVAYDEELALHLERAVPGEPVSSDRTDPRFLGGAVAAAQALAVMHSSGLDSPETLPVQPELDRLESVTHQMSLVHPDAGVLLRDLVVQLGKRLPRLPAEAQVLTHGDLKYDQFLEQDGVFTLVDFEDVGIGETSWDLGKWCSHAIPSMPDTWEDSDAAEQARSAFLRRYRELRPDATLSRFPVYEAVHLANRAMVLMWGQADGWQGAAESLLALAMERLQTPAP